jgi:hypothetical protein
MARLGEWEPRHFLLNGPTASCRWHSILCPRLVVDRAQMWLVVDHEYPQPRMVTTSEGDRDWRGIPMAQELTEHIQPEINGLETEMLSVLPLRLETSFMANACRLMGSDFNILNCLEQDATATNVFSPFGPPWRSTSTSSNLSPAVFPRPLGHLGAGDLQRIP